MKHFLCKAIKKLKHYLWGLFEWCPLAKKGAVLNVFYNVIAILYFKFSAKIVSL